MRCEAMRAMCTGDASENAKRHKSVEGEDENCAKEGLRVSCAMCEGRASKTGGEDVSMCRCVGLIERVRGGRVVLVSRM